MIEVIIRTDASIAIGSGHVMRCLTIAKQLQMAGCSVRFFMNELPGHLIDYVEQQGFQNVNEMQEAGLCIIDHYEIDEEWEKEIRPFVKKIVVIDDLANRPHDCDVLLDQNIVPNYENRYDELVPVHCVKLLGPNYLIMREEFIRERNNLKPTNSEVKRLLVFMGGADPTGETMKVLCALKQQVLEYVDIVVGSSNPQKEEIKAICIREGYHFHCQIDYIASLMGQADFSIGAGGSATWERCFVGLPSSSTVVAENQHITTETVAGLGAVWNLGWHEKVTEETYRELIVSLASRKEFLGNLSSIGLKLTEQTGRTNSWLKRFLEVEK
ncbi:UDP-2,4-diacetamido-2,4,6-trideoxy-beta-L-altropyranose hydrolase [Psychrobacillus sp.]|uniref:UDP-2,4-diacetamido-2,4, 6-trideoxy-beta-L-altropyranose hydrolase n=1 Tax=Psychrobacillus sp. TaxID=1871623 RepID=UPI0028BDEDC6|nr:UDP-2,4-diacetamido-2,4,6-trideoxy-beta-L-altropyranose hydrolase [Psychrobacillus sp.]